MSKKRFFVCSHTHWDREWYGTFQEFRIHLVRLMDKMIELFEKNPEFKYFNLDGQTITLNDYLEIMPENEKILKKLVSSGRLNIGPWYILPDEFLVSGEATIRNLLLGDTISRKFGKKSKVGYLPDMFGHISQMPQILKGFGIDTAVIWRGLSWRQYRQELLWESPDGTRVLTHHLPSCGYTNASFLAFSIRDGMFRDKLPLKFMERLTRLDWTGMVGIDDAIEYLKIAVKELPRYSPANCFLLMNGMDHMQTQEQIVEIMERANKEIHDVEFIHATFDQFFEALKKSIRFKKSILPVKKGVLRDTVLHKNGGGWILNGVLSSRIYLKIKNQECQILLEKWVEPFLAIGGLLGIKYQKGLIWKAWEYLLQNHPHDNICGCSIDKVHRQMETRFEWVSDISGSLLSRIFHGISDRVDTSSFIPAGEAGLVVFNPMQKRTSSLLDTQITLPLSRLKDFGIEVPGQIKTIEIRDEAGNQMPAQITGNASARDIIKQHTDDFFLAEPSFVIPVKLWLENLPALGYKTFRLKIIKTSVHTKQLSNGNRRILENRFIKAVIKPNGTIDLLDKVTGKTFRRIHYFEDGGDNGDTYNYSYLKKDKVVTTLRSVPRIELIENGAACISYRVVHTIKLPSGLAPDSQGRSSKFVDYEISTVVSLGLSARRLEFVTAVKNNVRDHRLRVCFPSRLKTQKSEAEAQFDVVEYPIHIRQPKTDVWMEDQPKQYPQQTFVDVSDGRYSLGIINYGLPEYEVSDDDTMTICLTLLRAVGYLARNNLNTRKGGMGHEIETPDAQCERELVFRYAVVPHRGKWYKSDVQCQAHEFNNGLFAVTTGRHEGDLPLQKSFIRIKGNGIVLSAIKGSEKADALIVRVWNSRKRVCRCRIELAFDIERAYCCDLKEEKTESRDLHVKGNRIDFEILSKQIKSFKVYCKPDS